MSPADAETVDLPPVIEDTSVDHADDIAAIGQVIADIETGFNTNDADLSVAHFARNGSAVNVLGVELHGWDALVESHRTGLAGPLADQRARYEVQDVTFVRPDVAIAHKHAWAVDPDGDDIDVGHAMVALYVLVKEDGRWWIASRQNTLAPT
jgi:uncharacterized protein (TIGR02246 family)